MYDNIFIIKNIVATRFNFDFYKETIDNIGASEWGYWTPNFEDGHMLYGYHTIRKRQLQHTFVKQLINLQDSMLEK